MQNWAWPKFITSLDATAVAGCPTAVSLPAALDEAFAKTSIRKGFRISWPQYASLCVHGPLNLTHQ